MTRVSSRMLSLKEHGKGLELEPRGRETHGEAGAVTYGHGDGTVLEFSKETEPIGCAYREKEIYYRELAHVIMETNKSTLQGVTAGSRPGQLRV